MLLNETQKLKKIKAHYVPCKTLGRQKNKKNIALKEKYYKTVNFQ